MHQSSILFSKIWARLKPLLVALLNRMRVISLWSVAKMVIRLCVMAALLQMAITHYRIPDNIHVHHVQQGVMMSGLLIFMWYGAKWMFYGEHREHATPKVGLGVVAYVCILSLIGNIGDEVVRHPEVFIPVLVVVLLSLPIVYLFRPAVQSAPVNAGNLPAPSRAVSRQKTSAQDRRFIAAHEAGHALVYAAWPTYPDDLTVVVKDAADASNSLGYVNKAQHQHLLTEKGYAEWDMLLSLAGAAGERASTGMNTLGSVGDSSRWLAVAVPYLSCLTRGMFYNPASTQLEIEQNERQLTKLREEQFAHLDRFFEINHDVHDRLTRELVEKGQLKGLQLHPFFAAAEIPSSFPRPSHIAGS